MLEYLFLADSEEVNVLLLRMPWPLCPLALMIHIAESHAFALLSLPCYFVKLETKIVGLWAIQEYDESLIVASLGIAKEYRRSGIGTCVLSYIEAAARRMGKRWLEVDVWIKNASACRLYAKYGFAFRQNERVSSIIRGKKLL